MSDPQVPSTAVDVLKSAPGTPEAAPAPAGASRRRMLKLTVIGAAGAATGAGTPVLLNTIAGTAPKPGWRFLTEAEARLVEAICEQIIPADQDPGARDANVVHFIDKQLVGHHRRHQNTYRNGLASVQKTAQQMFGKPFEQLAWDDQTKVLEAMESGKSPRGLWSDPSSQAFFGLIRDHTMQGFYGSPRHGGNRDYTSYKMLGLEYPRVIGRNKA